MLFLDIFPLSQAATDDVLEHMYKAGGHDHDDGIWKPHESVLIRRLVELFTQRGLDRLEQSWQQIIAWESGEHHKADASPPENRPGMMARWSEQELALVRVYLDALPPAKWQLEDHELAVEFVVQRYLPHDELRTEAEWLATKAGLMGKVQANMAKEATPAQANAVLAALPSTAAAAYEAFPSITAVHRKVMEFGLARCVENVRAISESARHRLKATIMGHLEQQMTTVPGVAFPSLQSRLLDEFGTLNRDWRRIAVTEAGEAQTQGYIASLPIGTKVERVEQYANACRFCKKIHGTVAEIVSPDAKGKNPNTQIWVGKNNIGRSASPRKRVGNLLVARLPEEMWQLPAGLAHPHCRGRWVPVIQDQPGDDKDFGDWLRNTLGGE